MLLKVFIPPSKLKQTKTEDLNKFVLHIKREDVSKAIGRQYLVHTIRTEAQIRAKRLIPRSEILVVGDRMGTSEGERDDSAMFVYGGINVAVGKEARPGAFEY